MDNASTDGTAEFARECWHGVDVAPLRVVREPEPGLSAARVRGLLESRYEFLSFIDDDNWVSPEWVSLVDEILSNHPEVGACGGHNDPVFESEPPAWFPEHQRRFAVGPQADVEGDITDTAGVLWGAGLSIRSSALLHLLALGFRPLAAGRRGNVLSSGEDHEICFALRLLGFRLFYDRRLQMRHYLPASRLQWSYLRRLVRENEASRVHRDAYRFLLEPRFRLKKWWWRSWLWQVHLGIRPLLTHPSRLRGLFSDREGDAGAIYLEKAKGRVGTLLRERGQFSTRIRQLHDSAWVAAARCRASERSPTPA